MTTLKGLAELAETSVQAAKVSFQKAEAVEIAARELLRRSLESRSAAVGADLAANAVAKAVKELVDAAEVAAEFPGAVNV